MWALKRGWSFSKQEFRDGLAGRGTASVNAQRWKSRDALEEYLVLFLSCA